MNRNVFWILLSKKILKEADTFLSELESIVWMTEEYPIDRIIDSRERLESLFRTAVLTNLCSKTLVKSFWKNVNTSYDNPVKQDIEDFHVFKHLKEYLEDVG